ncbi:hypothetical protein [uncultured Senegalimassilia sp.]|nr:hypothetical protein [uncultured Senegalimassilia sp.]
MCSWPDVGAKAAVVSPPDTWFYVPDLSGFDGGRAGGGAQLR